MIDHLFSATQLGTRSAETAEPHVKLLVPVNTMMLPYGDCQSTITCLLLLHGNCGSAVTTPKAYLWATVLAL